MDRVGDRQGKMERYYSTGQSPQRAVAPTEEEEESGKDFMLTLYYSLTASAISTHQLVVFMPHGNVMRQPRGVVGGQHT